MGQTLELKLEGLINNVIFKSEGANQLTYHLYSAYPTKNDLIFQCKVFSNRFSKKRVSMIQMADIIIPSFPPPPPPKLTKLILDSLNIAVQGLGDSHR